MVSFRWPLSGERDGPFSIPFESPEDALEFLSSNADLDAHEGLADEVASGQFATSTANPEAWRARIERT